MFTASKRPRPSSPPPGAGPVLLGRPALAQTADPELLATSGPLGEMALGDENAPR